MRLLFFSFFSAGAAALLAACAAEPTASSPSSSSGDDPNVPSAAADGGSSDSGGGDGGVLGNPDGGVQAKASDTHADACGNGIDDDGNGLIDDSCPLAKTCDLAFGTAIHTKRHRGIAFLNGLDDWFSYGDIEGGFGPSPSPAIERHQNGATKIVALPAPYAVERIHPFPGGPIAFRPGNGSAIFAARRLDPTTLADVSGSLTDAPSTPDPDWAPSNFDNLTWLTANKSAWAVGKLKGKDEARAGRFDGSLDLAASYDFPLVTTRIVVELVSLAGMPFVYDFWQDNSNGFKATHRLIALGEKGVRWQSGYFFEDWGTEMLSWSGVGHLVTAQAEEQILVCRGGGRRKQSATFAFRHELDCKILDAKSGSTIRTFVQTDYAVNDVSFPIAAAGMGKDFLLARVQDVTISQRALHLDRLSAAGVLTKDIVAPVSYDGMYIERLVETAPNRYAVVYQQPGADTYNVIPIGCAP